MGAQVSDPESSPSATGSSAASRLMLISSNNRIASTISGVVKFESRASGVLCVYCEPRGEVPRKINQPPRLLLWLFDERGIGVLLSLEDMIFHRDSAFLHQPRDEGYSIVVSNRGGHSDGHSFSPIQRSHPD